MKRLLGAVLVVAPALAAAAVSPRNGNLFVEFTDVVASDALLVHRVYNAKTPFDGMFGFGWGSDFETYLVPQEDGSVVVTEYGSGATVTYEAPTRSPAEVAASVEAIVAAAQRKDPALAAPALDAYRARLGDESFRRDEWARFRRAGLVRVRALPPGTRLESHRFGHVVLIRVPGGYVREQEDGRVEEFDEDGRLVRVHDRNGNVILVTRDAEGRIARIDDDAGRFLVFEWEGVRVTRVTSSRNQHADYRYEGRTLVATRDTAGNVYTYRYTPRVNLVEIGYTDGSTYRTSYHPLSEGESVRDVVKRNGSWEHYEYGGERGPGARLTTATLDAHAADGEHLSRTRYEWHEAVAEDGARWVERFVKDVDGDATETTYDRRARALRIVRAGDTAEFEYDDRDHVTRKVTAAGEQRLWYDAACNNVTAALERPRAEQQPRAATAYRYDDRCNLAAAVDLARSRSFRLSYDPRGRISRVTSWEVAGASADPVSEGAAALLAADPPAAGTTTLSFEYGGAESRPTRVAVEGVGEIRITYGAGGEIERVDSAAGRDIALRVTGLFTLLLDALRPAGVELGL